MSIESIVCRVRSARLATALLVSDVAIPASTGRLLVSVGITQPVIIRQVSLSVASSVCVWVERFHTGHAYSAAEQHSARAGGLSVVGVAPHFEVLSLRMMLFLVPTFFGLLDMCFIRQCSVQFDANIHREVAVG